MGRPLYSGEIENNGYANFWGIKKVHYGLCENGEYAFNDSTGEGCNHLITKTAWQKCWPIRAPHSYKHDFKTKTNDRVQGAKKIILTACHLGKLKLAFTSPDIISTSPKNFWLAELISQFFCHSDSSKNITCPSGKLKTQFTSLIAKSTSPRLSDTTFFARWRCIKVGNGRFSLFSTVDKFTQGSGI